MEVIVILLTCYVLFYLPIKLVVKLVKHIDNKIQMRKNIKTNCAMTTNCIVANQEPIKEEKNNDEVELPQQTIDVYNNQQNEVVENNTTKNEYTPERNDINNNENTNQPTTNPISQEEKTIKYDGNVPHLNTSIFSYNLEKKYGFPQEVFDFYDVFKQNMFAGIFTQLNGNYGYINTFLEDIRVNYNYQIDKSIVLNLVKWYGGESKDIKGYCSYIYDKNGIEYNSLPYYRTEVKNVFLPTEHQPAQKDEILGWLRNEDWFSCSNDMRIIVKSNGHIDIVKREILTDYDAKRKCVCVLDKEELPSFIHFDKVECHFIIKNFKKKSNGFGILSHQIKSLYGCPSVVNGDFVCEKLELEVLDGCPTKVDGNFNAKNNKLATISGVEYVGGILDVSNNNIDISTINTTIQNNQIQCGGLNIRGNINTQTQTKEQKTTNNTNKPSSVYLIHNPLNDTYKIGKANIVGDRFNTIKTSNPDAVLVTSKEFVNEDAAYKVETMLHNQFKDKHYSREWYKLTDIELNIVKALLS